MFFYFQFVAIFRLCPLEEAIQIIESILNKQIENKIQYQERPDSDLNKHIQAVHDSDAMSNDDKHDADDEKILQQQTSKDVQEISKHISGNLHDFSIYYESET